MNDFRGGEREQPGLNAQLLAWLSVHPGIAAMLRLNPGMPTTARGPDWWARKWTTLKFRRLLWKSSLGGWQGVRNRRLDRKILRRVERRKRRGR